MLDSSDNHTLPEIPAKRYFTIGEVSKLCRLKPHVLRYWEQEFPQLNPVKRRGNRRYYQRHEVELIRRIRELLYVDGFTINGARLQVEQQLDDGSLNLKDLSGAKRRAKEPNRELVKNSHNDPEELTRSHSVSSDPAALSGSHNATASEHAGSTEKSKTDALVNRVGQVDADQPVESFTTSQPQSTNSAATQINDTSKLEKLLIELKNLRSTLEN